jgi:hypothetical protein
MILQSIWPYSSHWGSTAFSWLYLQEAFFFLPFFDQLLSVFDTLNNFVFENVKDIAHENQALFILGHILWIADHFEKLSQFGLHQT